MATGYFSLVLHAHLPFVRHPEDPTVMEERWLQEAIVGTYLPLLQTFEGLATDGIPFRCTLSLSAPLITMLTDDLLKLRAAEHIDSLIELGEKEIERTRHEPHYQRLAHMYRDRFASLRHTWRCHEGNLVGAFRKLQDAGYLEVITSTATHPFFPLMDRNWAAMRAQVQTAAALYQKHFGRTSLGMWLGECGYIPGVDELLREAAVRYFLVDTHAILYADRRPAFGVYAPLYCSTGVAAFGRDSESSEQVWSAKHGYPGDKQYRDFYRDIGFDLPLDYIGPHVHPEGHRMYTGFKYQAITHDKLHDKWVYDPDAARGRAGLHASHFRGNMEKQAERLRGGMDRPPIIISPYDAELFGHWWYEGPIFLSDLYRQLHFDQSVLEPITPGDYLARHPTNQRATPAASSWGLKGYNEQWLNETNAWTYRHLHAAAERMVELAQQHRGDSAAHRGAGPQAGRPRADAGPGLRLELHHVDRDHGALRHPPLQRARGPLQPAGQGGRRGRRAIDEAQLAAIEATDNIFPDVDYRIYAT